MLYGQGPAVGRRSGSEMCYHCLHSHSHTFVFYRYSFSFPFSKKQPAKKLINAYPHTITTEMTLTKTQDPMRPVANAWCQRNAAWLSKNNTAYNKVKKKKKTPKTLLSLCHRGFDHTLKRWDSSYLIVVVMTMKERFLSEDHTGEHAAQTPHVQAVVIHLQTHTHTERV